MKKCSVMMIFLIMGIFGYSQRLAYNPELLPEYGLQVTMNKTTNLLFPYAIKSIDKGSRDILIQKAKGVENVLRVKAANSDFKATNLSVITADGELYAFSVSYDTSPAALNYRFGKPTGLKEGVAVTIDSGGVLFTEGGMKAGELEMYSLAADSAKNNMHGVSKHDFGMLLKVGGIYIKDDVLFFKLLFANRSDIGYDIEHLRFFIRDKKRVKRTAAQELELVPVRTEGNVVTVSGGTRHQQVVVAIPKFTIPQKKYLSVELSELHGGRLLVLDIHNKTLLKAKKL